MYGGSNLQGEGNIRNCSCYRVVKHLEHGMKVVVRVLGKMLGRIVSVDQMQFGFMPERGTIDAAFILKKDARRVSCHRKKVVCVFCGPRESF